MEASAAASPAGTRSRVSPNAVLTLVAVAQFMVVLDATVVNVALPTIKRDLGFSEQSLSWVLNAYTLIFGGFLLPAGAAPVRRGAGRSIEARSPRRSAALSPRAGRRAVATSAAPRRGDGRAPRG